VRPTIKLSNDLIVGQVCGNNGSHDLIGCHLGYTDVCRAANAVLAGVFASNRIIHGFRAKCAVNHNRLST
jgi:hypothetical protein